MLERIWSGWRSAYVSDTPVSSGSGDGGAGSVFSQLIESGASDIETHIVQRGETCFVIMNLFPYTSGHLLVVPYREVADLEQLTEHETAELWSMATTATGVIRVALNPDGINIGLNLGRPAGGSIPEHLHVHVVPRWTGDTNFMSAVANTQTLPESLDATAAKIRGAWAQ